MTALRAAARLQDAVDLGAVRGDLLTAVHQALEPAHVSVWIAATDGLPRGDILPRPSGR
jgi:hypothetical protein